MILNHSSKEYLHLMFNVLCVPIIWSRYKTGRINIDEEMYTKTNIKGSRGSLFLGDLELTFQGHLRLKVTWSNESLLMISYSMLIHIIGKI